jgi:hypothetical protein
MKLTNNICREKIEKIPNHVALCSRNAFYLIPLPIESYTGDKEKK